MKKWDDNTDKNIRDSLENLDFPFEEASWGKMEAMLNESADKPVSAFKNKYGYLALIVLLFTSFSALYSVGTYFDLFNQNQQQSSTTESSTANSTAANKVDLVLAVYPSMNSAVHVEQDDSEIRRVKKIEKQIVDEPVGQSAKNTLPGIKKRSTPKSVPFSALSEEMMEYSDDENANTLDLSDRKSNDLLALKSRSALLISDGFFGDGGIADLTLDSDSYKSVPVAAPEKTLSKEEKKQERANAREIRKKLGKRYRKTVATGTGKFSLRPLNWGLRLGVGVEIDRYFIDGLGEGRVNDLFPFDYKGIHAALFAEYVITERWHLQTEIAFSMLSNIYEQLFFEDNYFGLNGRAESSYEFRYSLRQLEFIDLQAVIQYKLKRRGTFELGGAVGFTNPTAFFSSSASWSPNTLRRQPVFQNADNAILDYNLQAIVGYEYAISRRFSLNTRYYFGLVDLTRESFFRTPFQNHKDFDGGSRLQISLKVKLNRVRTKSEDE
ncbi:MAG: outer membrane beta-barrel protein [Bacteroidota bacterium]